MLASSSPVSPLIVPKKTKFAFATTLLSYSGYPFTYDDKSGRIVESEPGSGKFDELFEVSDSMPYLTTHIGSKEQWEQGERNHVLVLQKARVPFYFFSQAKQQRSTTWT